MNSNIKPLNVRSVCLYRGSSGERIEEMTLCHRTSGSRMTDEERKVLNIDEPLHRYAGVVAVVNSIPTPLGVVEIPTDARFLIPANSLNEAFDQFQATFAEFQKKVMAHQQQMMEELQKQSAEEQILIPNAEETQSITDGSLRLVQP